MGVGEAGGRGLAAVLAGALIALVCAFALPAVASAETFEVNSTADETDLSPADGLCQTVALKCTLRAAIEQANSSVGEFDVVGFEEEHLFDGQATGTIVLGTALPAIVDPIAIEGECVVANVLQPCVGVDGPGTSEAALRVENTEGVEIFGLAITGAKTGIEVIGSTRFKALSNWLGVKLDGSAGGNKTGMLIGKGSENVRIGNEGVTNVFANNAKDGLDIHGAAKVRVLSGYFGVRPDGITPAPNGGKDIEVTTFEGVEAEGNRIGTQISGEDTTTPECDGGCNVISGAGMSGIDLEGGPAKGESQEEKELAEKETPAASTTVIGNYVGLDASGSAAIPNGADDIHVGPAVSTVIGGPRVSEANLLAGAQTAVSAGPGTNNLVVRGNGIGLDADGGGLLAPEAGIVVNSERLASSSAEVVIAGNDLGMEGGVAIEQTGLGGWISGNWIAGADIGIKASGETEEHGNLIEDNEIEGSALNGILIESSSNEVFGNEVIASGSAGIRIEGGTLFGGFGVNGNRIGGDVEADENFIAGSGGAGIEISNPEGATNEVARNWGFENAGLFIDLVPVSPTTEPKGPNEGIRPPKFFTVTGSEVSGGGAEAGARIRVFRKASAEVGEIDSFLGEAIADEEGEWKVAYDTPIAGGTIVAVTQTNPVGGTSELAMATTPSEPSGGGESKACALANGCGPAAPVLPVPQTKIFTGPKGKKIANATAAFKFKASVDGSTFQCKLDGGKFRKCHSPQVYSGLKPGKHHFQVRAINAAGQAGLPDKLKFTVLS